MRKIHWLKKIQKNQNKNKNKKSIASPCENKHTLYSDNDCVTLLVLKTTHIGPSLVIKICFPSIKCYPFSLYQHYFGNVPGTELRFVAHLFFRHIILFVFHAGWIFKHPQPQPARNIENPLQPKAPFPQKWKTWWPSQPDPD